MLIYIVTSEYNVENTELNAENIEFNIGEY